MGQSLIETSIKESLAYLEMNNSNFVGSGPRKILTDVFGFNAFKPLQEQIISRVLKKEGHTLAIMPTGGGKSLCYQIPALLQKNLTVIISPLIALMKDQRDNLIKKNIHHAFFINSLLSDETKSQILEQVQKGNVKMLYIAPESLKSERIHNALQNVPIDLLVVDEAHCISVWGHNFRPDYLRLVKTIKNLQISQILCLTATATRYVEKDIQEQLSIRGKVFKASFDRPNLAFHIVHIPINAKREAVIIALLEQLKGPTLIFATFQKTTENLAELLVNAGINATYYHAGLDREEREARQTAFIKGDYDVIVATIAFGMGIDKANIRSVIHFNIPQSIENYYQEVGRAGRDRNIAHCITLFTASDQNRIKHLISDGWPNRKKIEELRDYIKKCGSASFFTTARKMAIDCMCKEVAVNLIMHRLEQVGAIKIFPRVPFEIKLVVKKDLKNIREELPEYYEDIQTICKTTFFTSLRRKWFSFEQAIEQTTLHYFHILKILRLLEKKRYVQFTDVKTKDYIVLKEKIENIDLEEVSKTFDRILTNNMQKVDSLIALLQSKTCIRKNILAYFGEGYDKDNCEMCSNCLSQNITIDMQIDASYVSEKEIMKYKKLKYNILDDPPLFTILKAVIKEQYLPKKDIVKTLTGRINKTSKMRRAVSLGILQTFAKKEDVLEKLVEWLITHEYIATQMDGTLRITKKGIAYVGTFISH